VNFIEEAKGVVFTFELDDGKPLQLRYFLQQNSLREKWLNEVKTYRNKENTWLNLKISNKNITHLSELTEKLNSIVGDINNAYESKILTPLEGTEDVSRETLNKLHEIFEEYGENIHPYRGENVHHLWLDLNEWIHITETAMETTEDMFPQYSALVTVYPPYPGRKLEEKDKLFLSTEFSWGQLYLGYNTLGKDYASASLDDDVRVITNKQVKVQERYSSEVWLCFQSNSYMQKLTELGFYKWYETIDQEAQELIPIENLNTLALGRYYLGHISINDDLLKFHPIEEDWYFNHRLQKKWNNEIFSRVKKVIEMEIEFYE
jgi:hypothetical protein